MSELSASPCMGGFCTLRDKCLHYTDPSYRHAPTERKCDPGAERQMFFMPAARRVAELDPA